MVLRKYNNKRPCVTHGLAIKLNTDKFNHLLKEYSKYSISHCDYAPMGYDCQGLICGLIFINTQKYEDKSLFKTIRERTQL